MPDNLLGYVLGLEKRLEKLETRELSRVSSWNVGTGTVAGQGDARIDGDMETGGNLTVGDGIGSKNISIDGRLVMYVTFILSLAEALDG